MMDSRRKIKVFAVLVLGLLVGGGLVVGAQRPASREARTLQATSSVCSTSFCVDWSVLAGGLGPMSSDGFRLRSTLGQTMAGLFRGDSYRLDAGYWAEATDTPTPTSTSTNTPTNTPTPTNTTTPTATNTATATSTLTPTPTLTPASTPTSTATGTSTPATTPTPTQENGENVYLPSVLEEGAEGRGPADAGEVELHLPMIEGE